MERFVDSHATAEEAVLVLGPPRWADRTYMFLEELLVRREDPHVGVDVSLLLATLFPCVFGDPRCPLPPIPPSQLAWNDGAIPKMAQSIYDDRAFNRLPRLADALEDAGCDDADILSHCRTPGEHVRGCWVVDLLLGKS
jgi:hypothetical protein